MQPLAAPGFVLPAESRFAEHLALCTRAAAARVSCTSGTRPRLHGQGSRAMASSTWTARTLAGLKGEVSFRADGGRLDASSAGLLLTAALAGTPLQLERAAQHPRKRLERCAGRTGRSAFKTTKAVVESSGHGTGALLNLPLVFDPHRSSGLQPGLSRARVRRGCPDCAAETPPPRLNSTKRTAEFATERRTAVLKRNAAHERNAQRARRGTRWRCWME